MSVTAQHSSITVSMNESYLNRCQVVLKEVGRYRMPHVKEAKVFDFRLLYDPIPNLSDCSVC